MKNRSLPEPKVKPAKPPVPIVEHAGTPMVARGKRDCDVADIQIVPFAKFMHSIKPEIMDQIADALWHHNRLSRSNSSQRTPV
jgi:hypothetical protein